MLQLIKRRLGNAIDQMDLVDISSDLIHLTNNRYRQIMKISSINFELKSEDEQDAIINNYEAFLNSIGFQIQILVRTRAIDIDEYINKLKIKETKENIDIYKSALSNYRFFVKSLVCNNKILSRNFYIVVPFNTQRKSDVNLVKEQISVRTDIIQKNLSRLSINSRILNSLEIIELFYSFYNPLKAKIQPLSTGHLSYLNESNI